MALMRTPAASRIALAMAGATPLFVISPAALAPNGPGPISVGTSTVRSGGASISVGSLYSPRLSVVILPSSTSSSSIVALPSP